MVSIKMVNKSKNIKMKMKNIYLNIMNNNKNVYFLVSIYGNEIYRNQIRQLKNIR